MKFLIITGCLMFASISNSFAAGGGGGGSIQVVPNCAQNRECSARSMLQVYSPTAFTAVVTKPAAVTPLPEAVAGGGGGGGGAL